MELKKIELPFWIKRPILALGSQSKNTLCFAKDNFAYLSPIHPNLNAPEDFSNFEKDVKYFLKKSPKIIACDLHPEYQSTKYAQNLAPTTYSLQPIQHHHAHIASCMSQNQIKNQKVIGVAFDGTGLGSDNRIWGAEFLICDYKDFCRSACLKEIPLLGGEKAILEPARIALAWLYAIYQGHFLKLKIDFIKGLPKSKWEVLKKMYSSGFNSPLASSMGRLFDAVGSLVLAKNKVRFEAELAKELERITLPYAQEISAYKFLIIKDKDTYIIDPRPMFKEIISDLKHKEPKGKIAWRFHVTVAEMTRRTCLVLRKETRLNTVVLSGGVFQNNLLLTLVSDLLCKEGFQVFKHNDLSCNDSGISLGQVAIANSRS